MPSVNLSLFCLCITEMPKNESAQKNLKKLHKLYFIGKLPEPEGQPKGWPIEGMRIAAGARAHAAPGPRALPGAALWIIYFSCP